MRRRGGEQVYYVEFWDGDNVGADGETTNGLRRVRAKDGRRGGRELSRKSSRVRMNGRVKLDKSTSRFKGNDCTVFA
jgi:hypothetical protein